MLSPHQREYTQWILAVGDDPHVVDCLRHYLSSDDVKVAIASSGEKALTILQAFPVCLVLLDLPLSESDGYDQCRLLRASVGHILPILMLSPQRGVTALVEGLESGADDYIVKPFVLTELLARVRANLRRTLTHDQRKEHSQRHQIKVGGLMIEQAARQMWCGDTPLELTKIEYDLLEFLALHPGQVLPVETILQRVWGYNHDVGREMVKTYVYTLRKKFNECCRANPIQSKRGVGYTLTPDVCLPSCVPH